MLWLVTWALVLIGALVVLRQRHDHEGNPTRPLAVSAVEVSGPSPRVWRAVISVAITVGVFAFVLPQLADFSLIWLAIVDMTWREVISLVAAAAWNIFTYLLVMVAVLPGLRLGQAFVVGQTSTAVSATLPAGSAIGIGVTYSMYSAMGHGGPQVALATVLTGVWNNFVKLGLPIVALALLAVTGEADAAQLGVSLVGLAVLAAAVGAFAAMLASSAFARRLGDLTGALSSRARRLVGRPPVADWGDGAVRFRSSTIDLLRHRWLLLTIATVVSHLSLYIVLLLSLRHMDVPAADVTWAEALVAFAVVRLASALPITPGGLGVVELLLTGALIVAGGPRTPVVAAVLVYRFLTLVVQVLIGGVCYLGWQAPQLRRSRVPHQATDPR